LEPKGRPHEHKPADGLGGDLWTETVTVTVEQGYTGPLTNVVQAPSEEGAVGEYTHVVMVIGPAYHIYLPLVMRND
jgi:hypothetical protein